MPDSSSGDNLQQQDPEGDPKKEDEPAPNFDPRTASLMTYDSVDHSTLGYPNQNGTGTIKTDFTASDITKEELSDVLPESEENSPAKSLNKVTSGDSDITADVSIDGRDPFSPSIENPDSKEELSEDSNGKGEKDMFTLFIRSLEIVSDLR